ncbi:MAG: SRPBCC domain-containing protein [Chloroflexi bacterium]|nr:SRPBCC domain-containing protein [Chloroflexota bacterium]
MTNNQNHDIVTRRVFDAPVERVWTLWTDPDMFKKWWGPDLFDCPVANLDFREGGTSLVSMISRRLGFPEHYSTLHYIKIVSLERIEYLHNLADKDGRAIDPVSIGMPADFPRDLLNVVTFNNLGNGRTEVTLAEYNWPAGQMMENSKLGMEQCIEKMKKATENSRGQKHI